MGALPPAVQEFGAASCTRHQKRKISPRFLSHESQLGCWGSSGRCRCQCRPALVWDAERHHPSAMTQFHPRASYWWELGVTGLGLLLGCAGGVGRCSRMCFPLVCPGTRRVTPVQGRTGTQQGGGVRWGPAAPTRLGPLPPSPAGHGPKRPAKQQGIGQSHQTNRTPEQHRDRMQLPATILPCKVAQEGAGAWSLLHPDTKNN